MSYGTVISFEKQDKIGVINLINVAKANVIGDDFFNELEALEADIAKDHELRALMIIAEGNIFSSGIDIAALKNAGSEQIKNELGRYQRLFSFFQEVPIPVVCGVQGMVFGAGVELMLVSDIRVVDEKAKISMPEARFGLAPDVGGTTRLTKLVGPGWAKLMLLTGKPIRGKEALGIGLAQVAVPFEMVRGTCYELAKEIASLPPSSMRFVKRGVNLATDAPTQTGLMYEEAQSIYCCGSSDMQEAVTAFEEKRPGSFTGK